MNIFGKITRKLLLKNKTRTLVTIVGIILSTAMFTAVTTFIISLQTFVLNAIVETEGCWEGVFFETSQSNAREISQSDEIKDYGFIQRVGEAVVEERDGIPFYNYVLGAEDGLYNVMDFGISEGSRPQTTSEIMLPVRYMKKLGYKVGDTITLEVGTRIFNGEQANALSIYTEGEQLTDVASKTYTITGFFNRSSLLNGIDGDLSITGYDSSLDCNYGLYFTVNNLGGIFDFMDKTMNSDEYVGYMNTHSDLLQMRCISANGNVMTVMYTMAAILVGLIMLGSVSLINNAFSISVTERTKQFGLLSSIGATRKQIRRSVFSEALTLSAIGIPLGLLSGVAGIGVTLLCLSEAFSSLSNMGTTQKMALVVDAPSLLIAAGISLATVLISAWIPALRAMRITAIEAIRQSKDIKLSKRVKKVSPITKKLFGLEGTIASKHFKRNRKNYRATIISLTISIVLFVVASAFCDALANSVNGVYDYSSDIVALVNDTSSAKAFDTAENAANTDGITTSTIMSLMYMDYELPAEYLTSDYSERFLTSNYTTQGESMLFAVLDDASFAAYAEKCGLDSTAYGGDNALACILKRNVMYRDYGANKYFDYDIIKDNAKAITLYGGDRSASITLDVAGTSELVPDNTQLQSCYVTAYLPYSAFTKYADNAVFTSEAYEVALFAMAGEKSAQAAESMAAYFDKNSSSGTSENVVIDMYTSMQMVRNIILIINVFTYGFIVLISFISAANVFNTISTNLMLRRREFAMLRTIGMTKGGLNKMMNYECVLYGIKSSVYGVILSLIFVQLITMSVNNGIETSLVIPWAALGIALFSVFAVVFATMLYSMHRIKKDNPIEALRNENI